jgi:hypothetical protein
MTSVIPLRLQVADAAQNIVDTFQQTTYTDDIYIDEATGTYDVDCSGFVSWVLGLVAPNHLDLIPFSASETRLHAQDYYTFFSSLPAVTTDGWRQVLDLQDAVRGDLIAWPLPPSSGSTGHVFVVAGQPVTLDSDTMAVMAYDASNILHYDDSRDVGPGQRLTGVGSGTFHLQTQPPGTPVAFQFGPGDSIHNSSIAIARIEFFDD